MRLVFAFFMMTLGLQAHADYASAAQQVDQQDAARAQAERQVQRTVFVNHVLAAISRFGGCHGGFAVAPSGSDANYQFSTNDGWECQSESNSLACANGNQGRKFMAINWPWNEYYVHAGSGYIEAVEACGNKIHRRSRWN